MPRPGTGLPRLELATQRGPLRLPDDVRGSWVVILAGLECFEPVSTTDLVSLARRYDDLRRAGAELVAVAAAGPQAVMKWLEWVRERLGVEVRFPVAADPSGEASRALGASPGGARSVLVADGEGVVRLALYHPPQLGVAADELLRALRGLQLAARLGRLVPSGWPSSDLVGDALLVPPPGTEQEARERLHRHRCFDWWFCFERAAPEEEVREVRGYLERAARQQPGAPGATA